MDAGVRQVLQTSQEEAVICIQLGYLLPHLRSRKLVTDLEFRQYSDERRTSDERNRALMRLIETKGGEKSFDLFVEALEAEKQHIGHEHLAKMLRNGKASLKSRLIIPRTAPPPPPKPFKKDHGLVETTAARLDAHGSNSDHMRQIDIRLTNLEKDVSEIKRITSDMAHKLNMVVMVLNGLPESNRNDAYDYKKPIQVTPESIPVSAEPISASDSTYDDVRSSIGNDYIETEQYIEVGSHPKVPDGASTHDLPEAYTTLQIASDQRHEQQYEKPIPRQKTKQTQDEYIEMNLISKGNSGEYWLAVSKSDSTKVVIKKPASSMLSLGEQVHVLTLCQHPNIVKLISPILSEQAPSLVFEYAEKGQLREYLQNEKDSLHESKLIAMATNIACGMAELECRGFVHCNLKANNILVDKDSVCKLASFNNVLCLKHNEKYKICNPHRVAIRWQAPEVLNGWRFSSGSDVWSFGVLLSELFTYGDKPYPGMKADQVKTFVLNKNKMSQPSGCPKEVYKLMKECFDANANKRPSFKNLHTQLKKLQSKLFRTSSNSSEEYTT